MTRKEISELYLKGTGITIVEGDGFEFVVPYIVMDVAYNEFYMKTIHFLDVKHELKQLKSRWSKAYNSLDRDFFSRFKNEEEDRVIDFMDEFVDYLANDLTILKVQVWNRMKDIPEKDQEIVSAGAICAMLTEAAHSYLKETFRRSIGVAVEHPYMKEVEFCSRRFASLWFRQNCSGYVDLNGAEITTAVQAICNKIVKFGKNK